VVNLWPLHQPGTAAPIYSSSWQGTEKIDSLPYNHVLFTLINRANQRRIRKEDDDDGFLFFFMWGEYDDGYEVAIISRSSS